MFVAQRVETSDFDAGAFESSAEVGGSFDIRPDFLAGNDQISHFLKVLAMHENNMDHKCRKRSVSAPEVVHRTTQQRDRNALLATHSA